VSAIAVNELYVSKIFLFVDDEPVACAAAKRMARTYGVNVQTANSASVAISLLEHDPNQYFLILTDEIMPGMSGTDLLITVQSRWPHIRRGLISGIDDPEVLEKGYEEAGIFRYLSKPMSDRQLQALVEDACEDFLSEKRSLEEIALSRQGILEYAIRSGFSCDNNHSLFAHFPSEYLSMCQSCWAQAGLYNIDVSNLDSDTYSNYLVQRCAASIQRMENRIKPNSESTAFRLSVSLRQFGVRGLRKADRFIDGDETIFVAMFSTLKDYFAILGLEIKNMVTAQDKFINISLGSRFTYNDFFNPLLSSVERGVELACLKIEFFMLASLFGVKAEMDFTENFDIRVML